jgi:hypothetical protein
VRSSSARHDFLARREVQIHNITFHSELVDGEDAVRMMVYYAHTPKDDNTVARYSGDIPEHWPSGRLRP